MADRRSHALLNFGTPATMAAATEALVQQRPGLRVYDRRRKAEWALKLQERWLR